ncbi:HEAT repeat domain-containing protein [uncultured Tenacibaculum sp.]|uniref:HEAT repeat domain-containing protein n=1 Tax=uncultured Tenacibaculum sp. TaxID=174713 RepID=UPI002627525E|nr:HEAT repeat domain-containing protein [uncultured Tenacibaculum sp.]
MKKYIIILVTFFTSVMSFGQNIDDFKKDFQNATKTNFSETELNDMFRKYSTLLTPHSDITQLTASLKNQNILQYPLTKFKETDVYKNNIQTLFNSENPNQRLLSYLVIAGAGDINYEKSLLEKIKTEKKKGNLIWSGMALMHLKTKHTTELFDFLIENENFGNSHMIPLYFKLDKDSLKNTAYARINSDDFKSKILSAQILSITGKNKKTEELLLDAVKNWNYNIKGYAIYSVKELQIGNLKETFIPLLDSTQTRSIAIQALANSPTIEDVNYLKEISQNENPVSEDFLDAFFESKNIANVKYWLELVTLNKIPKNYYFNINKQPLLFSDEILKDVQKALLETENIEIQKYLIKVLTGRNDKISEEILTTYLDNSDSSVRYWTVDALKGNNTKIILDKLISMLAKPEQRVVSITEILIENKIDTLQIIYNEIYKTEQSLHWERSSIEYLSNFPKEEHKEIFLKLLLNEKTDFAVKRDAAMGLANLKDKSSIDKIIEVCEKERINSDYNAQTYLIVLSKIKGNKAKKYIESYKNSDEENVRVLVDELLKEWDK